MGLHVFNPLSTAVQSMGRFNPLSTAVHSIGLFNPLSTVVHSMGLFKPLSTAVHSMGRFNLLSTAVHSFRYGSFHGQDEQFLSRRFSTCRRTLEYTKLLPKHEYEVDSPTDMSIPEEEKKRYRQSITSK